MFKIYKVVLFSLALVLLSGCGGGSNSNSSTTYPSRQAFVKFLTTTANFDFTVGGSIGGLPVTGSGAVNSAALVPGTFLGVARQLRTTTITGTATSNGISQSLDSVGFAYYDSNYNLVGEIIGGDTFIRVTESTDVPATVVIGSQGTLHKANLYSDSSFTVQIGTETETYLVLQDTIPNSALLVLTTTEYDLDGNVESTSEEQYHLSTSGTITPIDITTTDSDQDTVVINFE